MKLKKLMVISSGIGILIFVSLVVSYVSEKIGFPYPSLRLHTMALITWACAALTVCFFYMYGTLLYMIWEAVREKGKS